MIARLAYAILAGIVALIVCIVLADAFSIEVLSRFAGLIGLLVAIVVFFSGHTFGQRL